MINKAGNLFSVNLRRNIPWMLRVSNSGLIVPHNPFRRYQTRLMPWMGLDHSQHYDKIEPEYVEGLIPTKTVSLLYLYSYSTLKNINN